MWQISMSVFHNNISSNFCLMAWDKNRLCCCASSWCDKTINVYIGNISSVSLMLHLKCYPKGGASVSRYTATHRSVSINLTYLMNVHISLILFLNYYYKLAVFYQLQKQNQKIRHTIFNVIFILHSSRGSTNKPIKYQSCMDVCHLHLTKPN